MAISGYSQEEKWENPAGSIENAKVVIEKDKVINLRPVSRRFESIEIEVPRPQPLTIAYNLKPTLDTLSALQVIVRPKTMRDQPLDKLYGLSAKLGYGNYQSPLVLINAGNKRSDEYMYNFQFNHFSSGRGAVNDAPYYSTRFGADGKFYLNNVAFTAGAGFHNQSYQIYGYDPAEFASITDKDYLKQRLNLLSVNLGLEDNNLKNSNDQRFEVNLSLLNNNHFDREIMLATSYKLDWQMASDWQLKLGAEYTLANQNSPSATTTGRHLIALKPALTYNLEAFTFTAGLNGFFQKDPADNLASKTLVFPNLRANYAFSAHHAVSLAFDGNVETVNQHTLYRDNLYLDTLQLANNNINNFNATISLQGNFSESFGYNLGYRLARYKRMQFFDNNPLDTARFLVVLDNGGVTWNRFNAKFTYVKNENLSFNLGAAYNVYATTDLAEAWHKPALELDFGSRFTIIEKLHTRLDYRLLTGIQVQDSGGVASTLSPVNDLNLAIELDLTERAGVFLELRNILGQNYQIFNNYPVNGFQILGGLTISF